MIFEDDLKAALSVLKAGGVILYPTDTVWGLGCDATNSEAVKKVYAIKKREDNKSLIILMDNVNRIGQYVTSVPEIAYELIDVTDTPLTIIYPGGKNLAPNLLSEDESIGIRICSDDFASELISRFRKPIVSTSANISGEKTPAVFYDISAEITGLVDYIVKYRQDDQVQHTPSSIIKIESNGSIKIIRK
jgi:L-threonylcarbamoyladenylate synthase